MRKPLFAPKLFSLLKEGISRQQLQKDLMAGVIVGIVALPLAIAFAIASGVSPDRGLVTAIIAGIIISVFGGSRVQIGGPTGAFIVIVYAVVQEFGVDGLIIATLMAGFILIAMGFARLGNLLKFVPYPLIVGFTSGIAVIIFSSQIKDFFGFPIESVPADFVEKWQVYFQYMGEIDPVSVIIAVVTIIITLNFQRINPKIPGSIVAILLTTLVVQLYSIPVATIETLYGEIPNKLSVPSFPDVDIQTIQKLIQPAFAIALLGGIESLLSAVVADGMIGGRHRSNTELIAQGGANVFSALFGGIPATGAIARTATNVNNGGRTPIAGVVHALVLLLVMLVLAPYAKLIPMACLAGILLVTFFLTVFFDLVIAIQIGIVLSSFVLMKRMSDSTTVQLKGSREELDGELDETLFEEEIPELRKGVVLYEVRGALFFGAAQTFQNTLSEIKGKPEVLILRMRHVPFIDATGAYRLKEVIRNFSRRNVDVILSGINPQVQEDLEKNEIYTVLEKENIHTNIEDSLARAEQLLKE